MQQHQVLAILLGCALAGALIYRFAAPTPNGVKVAELARLLYACAVLALLFAIVNRIHL